MKKIVVLLAIASLILLFIPSCGANVSVTPTEIYLTIDDEYIEGNTSKKITVVNNYYHDVSVGTWMEHPDIIEWMRANRTLIENISWITIEPSQAIIPSNSSASFYIQFNIPNETKNQTYDKHWEIWAAVKISSASENVSSSFKEGYLVRVYVDAPTMPEEPSSHLDQIFYDTLLAIGVAIILTIVFFFFRERKKRRNK